MDNVVPKEAPKQRLAFIDIFRCITIILMVCGHCLGNNAFVAYLYGFHMPAFFFISGFTSRFENGRLLTFSIRRALTILLPFFFYAMVFLTVKSILMHIPGYVSPFGYTDIRYGDALKLLWERGDVYSQPLGAIWFLPALFFAVLIAKVLVMASFRNRALLFCLSSGICILGFYLISIDNHDFLWILRPTQVLIAQYFVCLGYLFGNSALVKKWISLEKPWVSLGVFAVFLTVSIIFFHFTHFRIDMAESSYPHPTYFLVLSVVFGCMVLLSGSLLLARLPERIVSCMTYVGRGALAIMIFHFLFVKLFGLLLVGAGMFTYEQIFSVVPPDGTNFGIRLLYVIISIGLSLGLYEGLRRIPVVNFLCGFNDKPARKCAAFVDRKTDEFLAKE